MKEDTKNVTEAIKSCVAGILRERGAPVKEIILFGSRARSDADRYSDFDILIITGRHLQINEKMLISREIRQALARTGIDADIIIKSESEKETLRNMAGSIVRNAMREGIAI